MQATVEHASEAPVPSIYTNASRVVVGPYDFRVIFSEVVPPRNLPPLGTTSTPLTEVIQIDHVAIVMSPQHMKRLVATLIPRLEEYERKFGSIPIDSEQNNNAPPAATDGA